MKIKEAQEAQGMERLGNAQTTVLRAAFDPNYLARVATNVN